MTPPILRAYQHSMLDKVRAAMRSHKRVLLQSPTGSGKGIVVAFMIGEAAKRGLSAWLFCHRRELTSQLSESLWEAEVPHGRIEAGFPETKDPVQVASIQTLVRRLDRLSPPKLLCADECHHIVSATSRNIVDHCADSWLVGLTATPCRTDGRGLDDIFDALVLGPTVTDLTREGYLCPYRIFAPAEPIDTAGVHTRGGDWAKNELEVLVDQTSITGDAVAHYRKYVFPGTCLVYCVSRLHARHVTAVYRQSGINAVYVAGDTPKAEREQAIEGFRKGQPPVIVSVDLFGEGLDVPGLNAVQLLRPTQSLGLFLQMVGRGLRVEPGKKHLTILDHVGGCWRHGLPDDHRDWTLEGEQRRRGQAEPAGPQLRHCSECFSIFPVDLSACPQCGAEYRINGRLPEEIEGELREIEAEEHRKARQAEIQFRRDRQEEGYAGSQGLEELVALGIKRGYKPGWAPMRWIVRNRIGKGTAEFGKTFAEARRLAKDGSG